MLTTVSAGPITVRGVSVGGVYTSLSVPELGLLFDVGIPLRTHATLDTILLSHGHADHIGGLVALLGIRTLIGRPPPRVFMPAEIIAAVSVMLAAAECLVHHPLTIEAIGMAHGDERALTKDLSVRAIRTFHPVPSLAYAIVRRVGKLRPDLHGLPGPEIAARRRAGEEVSVYEDRIELAYATDTLISVLDHAHELLAAKVLIMECTYLDDRKPAAEARAGCHVHLDEVIERAATFRIGRVRVGRGEADRRHG